jgi:hypothetical protein
MSEELKPCPFCGKPFKIVRDDDEYEGDQQGGFWVEHDEGYAMYQNPSSHLVYCDYEDAVEAINTRPLESDMIEAMKAMIDYRDRAGALGFQLEKADDFINRMRVLIAMEDE